MKNGKSPRYDEIYAQALRLVDVKIITDLFNKIYKTGQIPKDWMKSTLVVLPKNNQVLLNKGAKDAESVSVCDAYQEIIPRLFYHQRTEIGMNDTRTE